MSADVAIRIRRRLAFERPARLLHRPTVDGLVTLENLPMHLALVPYEVEWARRQYNGCEPENRLVARSLERAWEEALAEQARLEADAQSRHEGRRFLMPPFFECQPKKPQPVPQAADADCVAILAFMVMPPAVLAVRKLMKRVRAITLTQFGGGAEPSISKRWCARSAGFTVNQRSEAEGRVGSAPRTRLACAGGIGGIVPAS